jgi:hypothetical protein
VEGAVFYRGEHHDDAEYYDGILHKVTLFITCIVTVISRCAGMRFLSICTFNCRPLIC